MAVAILAAALLSGCGASIAPHPLKPTATGGAKGSAQSAFVAACFPNWEQADMRVAASAKHPVLSLEVVGDASPGPMLTQSSLAEWLGDPAGTAATPSALLRGFTVHGMYATGTQGTIYAKADTYVKTGEFYIQEIGLTAAQQQMLSPSEPKPSGGPVTLAASMERYPQAPGATISDALQALLAQMAAQPSGIQAMLYSLAQSRQQSTSSTPQQAGYPTPRGFVDPAAPLDPAAGSPVCTAGPAWFVGQAGGLLEPEPVFLAVDAGGIAYGFAPGQFMLSSSGGGHQEIYWYQIPGITVPHP